MRSGHWLAALVTVALMLGVTGCGEPRVIRSSASGNAVTPSAEASESASPPAPGRKRYSGPVEHLSFPPLVAEPQQAFTGRGGDRRNEDLLTVGEFRRILDRLYADDFVLVDIAALVENPGSGLAEARLMLPPGKKPLVLSVTDPGAAAAFGMRRRLVLDRDKHVAVELDAPDGAAAGGGGQIVSDQMETIPILDRFVAEHPDFSLDGAKGVIALTGAAGVLGYFTSREPVTGPGAREAVIVSAGEAAEQRKAVAPVIERLAATGWTFASAGYAPAPDPTALRPGAVAADARLWRREVGSLVGETPVHLLRTQQPPGPALLRSLTRQGFTMLSTPEMLPGLVVTAGYARQNRIEVNGTNLLGRPDDLRRVFDPDVVVDPARPPLRRAPSPYQPTN